MKTRWLQIAAMDCPGLSRSLMIIIIKSPPTWNPGPSPAHNDAITDGDIMICSESAGNKSLLILLIQTDSQARHGTGDSDTGPGITMLMMFWDLRLESESADMMQVARHRFESLYYSGY
jgi:hypothetical protein